MRLFPFILWTFSAMAQSKKIDSLMGQPFDSICKCFHEKFDQKCLNCDTGSYKWVKDMFDSMSAIKERQIIWLSTRDGSFGLPHDVTYGSTKGNELILTGDTIINSLGGPDLLFDCVRVKVNTPPGSCCELDRVSTSNSPEHVYRMIGDSGLAYGHSANDSDSKIHITMNPGSSNDVGDAIDMRTEDSTAVIIYPYPNIFHQAIYLHAGDSVQAGGQFVIWRKKWQSVEVFNAQDIDQIPWYKHLWVYGICGLFVGIIVGIAGSAIWRVLKLAKIDPSENQLEDIQA